MSAPPFSAVVVIHDSERELAALLGSLERNLDPGPELIVVDTGGSDGGADMARQRGALVIEMRENPGFGRANNAGVEHASSDTTVLLNPDVEILDQGILALVAAARRRDGLFAPRLVAPSGQIERSAHPPPGRLGGLLPALVHPSVLPRPLRLRADPWRAERPRAVGWAVAACLAARTETLRRLGPFDPGAFLFYEDMDLGLRATAAGVPTILDPRVRLRHAGAHSTRRAYRGEPHDLLALRRREVVGQLGPRALELDDAAQALTFATRAGARKLLRRDASRELAQLRALRTARRESSA